jgi:uncharacterized damage-inducible protein DinB
MASKPKNPSVPAGPDGKRLAAQVLATWKRHNDILLYLLTKVPTKGLAAVPQGSKGRTVARQFAHLDRVRTIWLHFHATGERLKFPERDRTKPPPSPSKAELRKSLRASGQAVGDFLEQALRGEARMRFFGRDPVRWLGYLIAHESHHRGQIVLALKQAGMRLPDEVAIEGLWGKWIFGKP